MLRLLISTCALSALGCTGFSLGENTPGGDNPVDPPPPMEGEHLVGPIAVEPDEDHLWVVHEELRAGVSRSFLASIDPVSGRTHEVADVSDTTDRRVMFASADRMLLMAQDNGTEHLTLIDTTTRMRVAQTTKPTWYWGTRTAPSGRAVAVADNADPKAPLHLIDLQTLGHQVLPHDGDYIEAMWNKQSDILIALSVVDPEGTTERPHAKLLRYDLRGHDYTQPIPPPTTIWELSGYGWDFFFSFTWIGVSPDDRWAVFPVIKYTGVGETQIREHVLLVLDQTTGGVRQVAGRGPVGFTRDSSSIVSYGIRQTEEQQFEDLWLIDPITLQRTTLTTSYPGVSFAPMRFSDHVLATSAFGGDTIEIHDVKTRTKRISTMSRAGLQDFVTYPGHAWLESGGLVHDVVLSSAAIVPVATPTPIGHINIRPAAEQVVMAARAEATIYRASTSTRRVEGEPIRLPSPFGMSSSTANERRTAPATPSPQSPRLVSQRDHDGDAMSLDPR